MKTKLSVVLFGALLLVAGCVSTPDDRHAMQLVPGKSKYESRYERSVDQVYGAALEVIKRNGIVEREGILNPGPNQAKTIEGKVNGRKVWARVEAVDQKVSAVLVQVLTKMGGTDQDLTQELQKQIGIELATR